MHSMDTKFQGNMLMLDYDAPNVMRRRLRYGHFGVGSQWVSAVEAAIDAYEHLRDNPCEPKKDSLGALREVFVHRSGNVSGCAVPMGRVLTRNDGVFFDLLDELVVDRKVVVRRKVLECIHRESFVRRSLSLIDKLSVDRRSPGCRGSAYYKALLLVGRNVGEKIAAWAARETDADCHVLLQNLKELTENGFRYVAEDREFEAFNCNGNYVRLFLSKSEQSDLTTEALLSIANSQTVPDSSGHFQFRVAEMGQRRADKCDLVCMNCDQPIPWGWLREDPCPHCGEATYILAQDLPKWTSRVSKDELRSFAVGPDDFQPPKRL